MNLGIVTPQLSHYGGSEVYLLECCAVGSTRWTSRCIRRIYRRSCWIEFEVGSRVKVVRLPGGRQGRDAFFYNTVVLPRVWEQ